MGLKTRGRNWGLSTAGGLQHAPPPLNPFSPSFLCSYPLLQAGLGTCGTNMRRRTCAPKPTSWAPDAGHDDGRISVRGGVCHLDWAHRIASLSSGHGGRVGRVGGWVDGHEAGGNWVRPNCLWPGALAPIHTRALPELLQLRVPTLGRQVGAGPVVGG